MRTAWAIIFEKIGKPLGSVDFLFNQIIVPTKARNVPKLRADLSN